MLLNVTGSVYTALLETRAKCVLFETGSIGTSLQIRHANIT